MHLRIILVLEVERYTDVRVRYVPRFWGHGSIRFRYNKKKTTMLSFFSFILNTIVQITFFFHQDVKILHIIYMVYV